MSEKKHGIYWRGVDSGFAVEIFCHGRYSGGLAFRDPTRINLEGRISDYLSRNKIYIMSLQRRKEQ